MSRRFGADDAPTVAVDKAARPRLSDARAHELRAVYHPGATERLRLRLVAELARVHEERLGQLDAAGAGPILEEIRTLVFCHGGPTRLLPSPSRLVQEQGLHLAQALVGALRAAVRAGRYAEAEACFADAARARRFAPDNPSMDDVWSEALAWGHRAALEGQRWVVAWGRLDDLRRVAVGSRTRRLDALARALCDAHHDAQRHRRLEAAHRGLHELRRIAARAHASTPQRAALCRALRQAHAFAGPGRRSALLTELAHWAHRPTATEDMRREHSRAVAQQRREAGEVDLPLGMLRTRAYRSDARVADAEALFVRIEAELDDDGHCYAQWSTYLSELRELAARADAPPRLRLRFAQRWLAHRIDSNDAAAAAGDRASFVWSQAAARRQDRDGMLLLGHCHRQGRGTSVDEHSARQWYGQAAEAGSSEARFWLRYTANADRGAGRATVRAWLPAVGLALLAVYAPTAGGLAPDPIGVAMYLALQLFVQLGFRVATGAIAPVNTDADAWSSRRLVEGLRRRPWRLLLVAAEDGLVLVPAIWLGLNPLTAVLAGLGFGALHHPTFGWRMCVAKGLAYALAAALLLPAYGLWTLVFGHVVFDALVVILASRSRPAV